MKFFKNRQAAGKILANHLKQYQGMKNTIVLAIPRGGVVVAAEVAKQLKLPLDIIVTRKIGAPAQPELALGAVDADGKVIWDEKMMNDLGLKINDLQKEAKMETEEIERRQTLYRQGLKSADVFAKKVILVDDGIATGATTLAAINFLKRHGVKKIILAAPVVSQDALKKLKNEVEVVVLEIPEDFQAVGQFYQHFLPVSDQEVIKLTTQLSSRI